MSNLSLFDLLIKYNDALYRGNNTVSQFLEKHFEIYIKEYTTAISADKERLSHYSLFEEETIKIDECSKSVLDILSDCQKNNYDSAKRKAFKLFDKHKKDFPIIKHQNARELYHIRNSADFNLDDKKEMFHISNNKKELITAHRYNLSGEPCWYLSNDLYLCWLECALPDIFCWCKIKTVSEKPLKLINFFRWNLDSLYLLKKDFFSSDKNKKNKATDEILKYYTTYPIFAACSLKVENRNAQFVEEYLFPQLFMSWIKSNNDFDGVAYSTELNTTLFKGKSHYGEPIFNIALPTKCFNKDGYDISLANDFEMNSINKLQITEEIFSEFNSVLDEAKLLINDIYAFWATCNCSMSNIKTHRQILSICESIIAISEMKNKKENFLNIAYISIEIDWHIELIDKMCPCELVNRFSKMVSDKIFSLKNKFDNFFEITVSEKSGTENSYSKIL